MLVVLAALPIGAVLRPAGADPVSDLKSQAATVAQDLVLEQLQVDAAQQLTSVAAARVAADQQAIARLDQQLATDQQAIDEHLHVVRTQAIAAYVDSGADASSSDATLFSGGAATAQAASEYASLAVGNITTDLDQLHSAQHALQAQQATLVDREAEDRADLQRQATDLGQASASADRLQAEQAQVTGQLAAAVAAQQAVQAKAAAAAVAAARKVAVPSTPSATVPPSSGGPPTTVATTSSAGPAPSPSSGDPYPNLPDPVLNAFLTCVVQAESGGDYGAVSPNGLYMGAFQFSQPTWNSAASAAGLGLLVGVPPSDATKPEQDTVAVALYAMDGDQPWLGDRCS
ncbi:MAG: transglycosylase family protein [Acidimicrobiales bacterium]